jgi:hypothetical protein
MTVSVALMTKATSDFKDTEQDGRFWYVIHPSGALCVMVAKGGGPEKIHKAYGPAAWLSAEGQAGRP